MKESTYIYCRYPTDSSAFGVLTRKDEVFCIVKNSKSDEVRKFFVQHEGKKTLAVQAGAGELDIENIDYSWLFDQFSQKIEENNNVPEYVQQMMHGWTLLLEMNSVFRNDLTDWEQKINGVSN